MERLSASTSNLSETLSKRPDARWNATVTQALAGCALHFRQELTELDYEVYLRGLADISSAWRIVSAIGRCTKECMFMPKLKEILERVPEVEASPRVPDRLKLLREFDEPYTSTHKLHVYEYEGGYRQVKMVQV